MTTKECPKCDSEDVLVGTVEQPHHCADCGEEWYPDEEKGYRKKPQKKSVGPKMKKEDIHIFKSPEILVTINQDFRRKSKLTASIDKALQEKE